MIVPFFTLAAQSASGQRTFRNLVIAHILLLVVAAWGLSRMDELRKPMVHLGHVMLVAGIVEGAVLVGWRLAQLPKSQALEFLLVSPLQPRGMLLAEALVGLTRLGLVTLSGAPVFAWMTATGYLEPADGPALLILPFTWGALTGLGLTTWAY
jgi:hypothetical protein